MIRFCVRRILDCHDLTSSNLAMTNWWQILRFSCDLQNLAMTALFVLDCHEVGTCGDFVA
ncbi:hypothetical protein [Helicobacter sp. 23-1045]